MRKPIIFAAAVLGLLAGCASPPGERDGVVAAAREWLAAVDADDPAAQCRLLSPAARQSVATGDETCEQAVADLDLPGGRIGPLEIWSDRAQLRTGEDTVFLVKLTDGWRVAAAGCRPQADLPYDCDVEA